MGFMCFSDGKQSGKKKINPWKRRKKLVCVCTYLAISESCSFPSLLESNTWSMVSVYWINWSSVTSWLFLASFNRSRRKFCAVRNIKKGDRNDSFHTRAVTYYSIYGHCTMLHCTLDEHWWGELVNPLPREEIFALLPTLRRQKLYWPYPLTLIWNLPLSTKACSGHIYGHFVLCYIAYMLRRGKANLGKRSRVRRNFLL